MPIEFLGLQSFFSSLFGYSHNGGTWFISCILFCYLAYPFLQEGIKAMGKKGRIRLMAFCMIILLYAPIVVHVFSLKSI